MKGRRVKRGKMLWFPWVFFEDQSPGDGLTPGAATNPLTPTLHLVTWALKRGERKDTDEAAERITSPKLRA